MRRYLLDTGIFTDLVNGRSPVIDKARVSVLDGGRLGVCPPILGEIHYGIEKSQSPDRTIALMNRLILRIVIWPYDHEAAKEYGRISAFLEKNGRRIKAIDMQIAAVALTLPRTTVVTKDKHFQWIPGLSIEDWSKDPAAESKDEA